MAEAQWIVFRLGFWQYAVSVERVREVLKPVSSVRMPRVAPFILGLFNLRGQVMPLVDTKARIGLDKTLSAPADGKARVVVVDALGGSFGLLVDEVLEVLRWDDSALQAPENILELPTSHFVESVLDLEGRLMFVLDLERLLSGAVEADGAVGA